MMSAVYANTGHSPTHPAPCHSETVSITECVINGEPTDPDAMFRVLDLLDQHHRTVEALDESRNCYNRARRELRDMAKT
jgi:hypothetical protein